MILTVCPLIFERRSPSGTPFPMDRQAEKRQFPDPGALTGSTLHQYLVLRGGIRAEESAIDWLDEVATALDRRKEIT